MKDPRDIAALCILVAVLAGAIGFAAGDAFSPNAAVGSLTCSYSDGSASNRRAINPTYTDGTWTFLDAETGKTITVTDSSCVLVR